MRTSKKAVERFNEHWNGNDFDIVLNQSLIMLEGDSGTGKSYLADVMSNYKDKYNIQVYDYRWESRKQDIEQDIKSRKGYLFVIDNADLLLDDRLRDIIVRDLMNNQYLLMGRDPRGLHILARNIRVLRFRDNKFVLEQEE
ncbi:MAG: hypothetical protein K5649_00020 [Lachnospiraceae bacterium]|nr:hypothetical protein [Lachnospiraceae bacterium]